MGTESRSKPKDWQTKAVRIKTLTCGPVRVPLSPRFDPLSPREDGWIRQKVIDIPLSRNTQRLLILIIIPPLVLL